MEILGVIAAGIIIGLLGKLVAPGDKDNIPLWLTVLCGVVGVIAGYYIAAYVAAALVYTLYGLSIAIRTRAVRERLAATESDESAR